MNESPGRVGLVGCGRISKTDVDAIRNVRGLGLAAVCDTAVQRARPGDEHVDLHAQGAGQAVARRVTGLHERIGLAQRGLAVPIPLRMV
jgi:predicted homoserine dehydrogenase-like protein